MHGRLDKRGSYGRDVRLVRVSPHDGRVRKREERQLKRHLVLLLAVYLLVFLSGGGLLYSVLSPGEPEPVAIVELEQLAHGAGAESTGITPEDIVLIQEPEPKIPLIIIDPGHGGEDEGCSRGDVAEREINLLLAQKLAGKLEEMGFETLLTRADNVTQMSLEDRVELAEDREGDLYISIHQNACEERESSVSGIESWVYGGGQGSRRLAQLVHRGALEKTGAKDREIRESDELYVIREVSVPSCLIETAFLSNRKEREKITDPAYQEKLAAGIAQGIQYYFYPKTMYLTFDDGPSEENTTAVLDILKERGIKATFFLVGKNVEKHPEVVRRIVEEGHTIGIHCYSHDYGKIYASVDAYLEDFQKAWNVVYETTGVEVELFRFPGGSINAYNKDVYEDIIDVMTEQGYVYFDWNASLEDAAKKTTPEMLLQNARESTLGRKKVVMLAHDIQYNTVLCLEDLIDQFPEYKMEPLSIEVTPIQF